MSTEFRARLTEKGIRFLLIGGQAMRLLGCDRETKDHDYLIEVNVINLDAAYAAIVSYLGYIPKFQKHELLSAKKQMKLPGSVDVLTSVEGLQFSELYSRSHIIHMDGVAVHYPCVEDMLRLKSISSTDKTRNGDLADIACLENLRA
jgi:hypothetical protein